MCEGCDAVVQVGDLVLEVAGGRRSVCGFEVICVTRESILRDAQGLSMLVMEVGEVWLVGGLVGCLFESVVTALPAARRLGQVERRGVARGTALAGAAPLVAVMAAEAVGRPAARACDRSLGPASVCAGGWGSWSLSG